MASVSCAASERIICTVDPVCMTEAHGNRLTWLKHQQDKEQSETVRLSSGLISSAKVILANSACAIRLTIRLLVAAQLNTATIQTTPCAQEHPRQGPPTPPVDTKCGCWSASVAHHLGVSGKHAGRRWLGHGLNERLGVRRRATSAWLSTLLGSINCLTIRSPHRVHVLRCLHAPSIFKRAHARLNHQVRHR